MLNKETIKKLKGELILNTDPFPHIIKNNMLPLEIAKQAEEEFLQFDTKLQDTGACKYGNLKRHFSNFKNMPLMVKEIISFFYSKEFIEVLEEKFKIKNIIPDWKLWGGGMHVSKKGGHLTIHSDFLYQRVTNTKRVLNLLLYLNSGWKENWGGDIELWDKKMSKKIKQLSPLINNCLIFRTDKNSNHGFPDPINCPKEITRKSIALYYYVKDKSFFPIKIVPRKYFTTIWKKRPSSTDPEFMDNNNDNLWRKIKYKFLPRIYLKK